MTLVLGVGLNKTGTTSLHRALEVLGWRSLHWGGPAIRARVERALAEGRPMLDGLDAEYDAFSDILPLARHHDRADHDYPGSRFVLTVRDVDDWIDSRVRHVRRNQRKAAAGEYHGTFLHEAPDQWRAEWHQHLDRVRRHFAGRAGDLLELDVTAGNGWRPLCDFLGVPEPAAPFPALNVHPDDPVVAVDAEGSAS